MTTLNKPPIRTTWGLLRQRIASVAAVLAVLAGLVTNLALTAATAHAVNDDGTSRFATYNMQGSDNGLRWTSEIGDLAQNNPLLALQEVGSGPPAGAGLRTSRPIRLNPPRPNGLPGSVTETIMPASWAGGTRYVYYLQTDPQRADDTGDDSWDGGQINLAMVTDSRVQRNNIRVLENPLYDPNPNAPNNRYRERPLLGLRFGTTWYWNVHGRGEDVPALLDQVRNNSDGQNWVLVGDFNLNILNSTDQEARDRSLHLRADETLLRTNQPTHMGSVNTELDYAVTHGLPAGFTATRPGGLGADHIPVVFARTPPPAQPPTRARNSTMVLATTTGQLLQENANGSLVTAEPTYNSTQNFENYTTASLDHRLRNPRTRLCVGIGSAVRRDASSPVVAGSCDDPSAQWSVSHPKEFLGPYVDSGGAQVWRNVAFPELCLTPGDTSVTAAPCTDDAAQRWWDEPMPAASSWLTTNQNVRLQSLFAGARLFTNTPANVTLRSYPRPSRWNWIYWLRYEARDFGWNIQQVDPADNVVRLRPWRTSDVCLGVRDVNAGTSTDAMFQLCDPPYPRPPSPAGGAGQRWLVEMYKDGSLRFRNEANHLCLQSPDADNGNVAVAPCEDYPAQRWNVTTP
ncbi:hypothetical protein ABZT04_00485 [Streptomyces sp. NPDC005492]|uniref:hypothetical protein n=1 Tax=Streptomyces sp. NPDC005492 TaxID=3156883 RepID=UPI0033B741DE